MRTFLTAVFLSTISFGSLAQTSQADALRVVDSVVAAQRIDVSVKKRDAMIGVSFTADLKAIWDYVVELDQPGWTTPIINHDGNEFRVVNRAVVSDMCRNECAVRLNLIINTPEAARPQTPGTSIVFLIVENGRWKVDDILIDGKRLFKSALRANY
jgi:hypothetical protein